MFAARLARSITTLRRARPLTATTTMSRSFASDAHNNDMVGLSDKQKQMVHTEDEYGAHNYHPLPVVLSRGEGPFLYDIDGKRYYDYLSAYSAVNQGHCHPKIIGALVDQAQKLTLTSRAFYNDQLAPFVKFMHDYFSYLGDMRTLPMNSGAEAVETAIKLSRKWAYEVKKVPDGQAKLVVAQHNFHGRTTLAISCSTDPDSFGHFGPLVPNIIKIPYNDLEAMENVLKSDPTIAGVMIEPIQGEAGIIVPQEGYLSKTAELCKKYNALFIADEVQTGLCRTGKMLAIDHENVKPDILVLGKALSGGVTPVSAVLARSEIMLTIRPGQHGSTFGGNPLACRVAMAALQVLRDEKLDENAERMGRIFRQELSNIKSDMLTTVRGRGLLNAIVIRPKNGKTAWDLCIKFRQNGLLAKPTHKHTIRLAPPLCINEQQTRESVDIIRRSLEELEHQ